jgi:hypothetical protein
LKLHSDKGKARGGAKYSGNREMDYIIRFHELSSRVFDDAGINNS